MDLRLRQLERAAACGDWEARAALRRLKDKLGILLPDILRTNPVLAPYDRDRTGYLMDGTPGCRISDRRVAHSTVKGYRISTVLLTLDHNFGRGDRPVIFETMVFGEDWLEEYTDRYTTVEAARLGHNKVVRYVEDNKARRVAPDS